MEAEGKEEKQPPTLLISYGPLIDQKHSLYNLLENKWVATTIPLLYHEIALPCNYGWIALLNPFTHHCSLWNPHSTEIILLPELPTSGLYEQCVLSKPPTEFGCRVLFNSANKLAYCQIGGDAFVEIDEEMTTFIPIEALISFRGNIYALVGQHKLLVTISIDDEGIEFNSIMHISPQFVPWANHINYYLIDGGDDEMMLVFKMSPDTHLDLFSDFKIFRIDINRPECVELLDIGERAIVELLDIGERAIFLPEKGDALCCSSIGIKPNSIYYTHRGKDLRVYNLDNRAITILLPCLAPCLAADHISTTSWTEHSFSQLT